MQIQSGIGAGDNTSPRDFVEVIKVGSKRRVEIELLDDDGEFVSISEVTLPTGDPDGLLDLSVTSLGETSVYAESYWPNPVVSARRVQNPATGKYYLTLGDVAAETATSGTYVANWTARINATSEEMVSTQVLEIISTRVLSIIPRLRLQLDRSLKLVDLSQYCFLGYTSAMLVLFLRSGLEFLNSYQPYPIFLNLDAFPIEYYAEILIKAATYVALESQMLFAVDTDIPSYSDGHSFVLTHQAPLAAYLGHLKADLDSRVPNFKRHFISSGTCKVQPNLSYAFAALLSAAPFGANFRGMWTAT